MKQRTLRNSFTVEGKGLHSGLMLKLTFHPAPAGTGIQIKRADLENQPVFQAVADYVSQTVRGTVLKSGDAQVSTIEHAMATLYAFGIGNCLMEVNGPEFPILDGSARIFTEKIIEAGIVELDEYKEVVVIDQEIEYRTPNGSYIIASPAENTSFEVSIDYNSEVLPAQSVSFEDFNLFQIELSKARTFVFVREIEPLLNMNLIRGGDLKNAIVIYDQFMEQENIDRLTEKLNQPKVHASAFGYLTGDLNYENEPARHKLVDLIGDLALAGITYQGKIRAHCPGHHINTEFAKLLREKYINK
jgi:UDP-3-O-[3-hydroxymyristoyl] N-acetylglucosamine deacetylase/3-hydroxyacyl-[acyl-carrier-protein] dehydratase